MSAVLLIRLLKPIFLVYPPPTYTLLQLIGYMPVEIAVNRIYGMAKLAKDDKIALILNMFHFVTVPWWRKYFFLLWEVHYSWLRIINVKIRQWKRWYISMKVPCYDNSWIIGKYCVRPPQANPDCPVYAITQMSWRSFKRLIYETLLLLKTVSLNLELQTKVFENPIQDPYLQIYNQIPLWTKGQLSHWSSAPTTSWNNTISMSHD